MSSKVSVHWSVGLSYDTEGGCRVCLQVCRSDIHLPNYEVDNIVRALITHKLKCDKYNEARQEEPMLSGEEEYDSWVN